jgi:hypothetical protein
VFEISWFLRSGFHLEVRCWLGKKFSLVGVPVPGTFSCWTCALAVRYRLHCRSALLKIKHTGS